MGRDALPLVVPSSMVFYTQLMDNLVRKNPTLARDVIRALNTVDRSRNKLYRSVLGEKNVR